VEKPVIKTAEKPVKVEKVTVEKPKAAEKLAQPKPAAEKQEPVVAVKKTTLPPASEIQETPKPKSTKATSLEKSAPETEVSGGSPHQADVVKRMNLANNKQNA